MGDDERNQVNTADTMRERSGESSLKIKLLLRTNRFAVTGVLAAFVFAAFILFAVLLDPSLQSEIRSTDTIETIFGDDRRRRHRNDAGRHHQPASSSPRRRARWATSDSE